MGLLHHHTLAELCNAKDCQVSRCAPCKRGAHIAVLKKILLRPTAGALNLRHSCSNRAMGIWILTEHGNEHLCGDHIAASPAELVVLAARASLIPISTDSNRPCHKVSLRRFLLNSCLRRCRQFLSGAASFRVRSSPQRCLAMSRTEGARF